MRLFSTFWLVGACASGCLVTDEIGFEEENVAPRLTDDPSGSTPIGRLIEIDESVADDLVFSVLVEDRNVGQTYVPKYRLTTLRDGEVDEGQWWTYEGGLIPPPPDLAQIAIPLSSLDNRFLQVGRCARLDLWVSSDFEPGPETELPQPRIEGDLAKVSWTFFVVSSDTPTVDPATCPTQRAQLGP